MLGKLDEQADKRLEEREEDDDDVTSQVRGKAKKTGENA